jgi:hypothetical protein
MKIFRHLACPVCIAEGGVTLEAQLSHGRLGRGTAEQRRENRLERRLVWRPRSVRCGATVTGLDASHPYGEDAISGTDQPI